MGFSRNVLWLLVGVVLSVGGCEKNPTPPEWSPLEQAMNRWYAQHLDHYYMKQYLRCWCVFPGTYLLRVRNGTVVEAWNEQGESVSPDSIFLLKSVEDLFQMLLDLQNNSLVLLQVEYHSILGYPTQISVDLLPPADGWFDYENEVYFTRPLWGSAFISEASARIR